MNVEILAHVARESNLQTRLLQTLDVLDEAQRTHASELKDLEQKYARLHQRFQRYVATISAFEAERDDLKESVLELVEKGMP